MRLETGAQDGGRTPGPTCVCSSPWLCASEDQGFPVSRADRKAALSHQALPPRDVPAPDRLAQKAVLRAACALHRVIPRAATPAHLAWLLAQARSIS